MGGWQPARLRIWVPRSGGCWRQRTEIVTSLTSVRHLYLNATRLTKSKFLVTYKMSRRSDKCACCVPGLHPTNKLRFVCFNCRLYRKNTGVIGIPNCSTCGDKVTLVDFTFEPPKKSNIVAWEKCRFGLKSITPVEVTGYGLSGMRICRLPRALMGRRSDSDTERQRRRYLAQRPRTGCATWSRAQC